MVDCSPIHITELCTYPVKSCGALAHTQLTFNERGPLRDRHWMLVRPDGMFVTQRDLPRMALIQPAFVDDQLCLTKPGRGNRETPLNIPMKHPGAPIKKVQVWQSVCEAWDEGDQAATWFSDFLKVDLRLVRITDHFQRAVNPEFARFSPRVDAHTGFADGYPILMVSEGSLDELNRRLRERGASPVPMNRFRPNIVVAGCEAFAEDTWRTVQIGNMTLDIVKPCARCVIPTIDQQTGQIPNVKEPTATLSTFRKQDNNVLFAQNAIHRENGVLQVGDSLSVLNYQS